MKFVDVTNDIAFRKIFGNENKKISLISFLNAVINLPDGNKIKDADITNPYQMSKLTDGKNTIVDVKAKDKNGNTFIVEMQIAELEHFNKRILYYTSQSYVSQIGKGKKYGKLNPAYFIGILDFQISKNPKYFSCHKVLDVETNEHIVRDIEFNFIELPKFKKKESELETIIDQWTYFIKNAENLEVIPENVKDKGLKEAYLEANKNSWSNLEMDEYERASIKQGDIINHRLFNKLRLKEAKKELADAKKEAQDAKKEALDSKKESLLAKNEAQNAKKEADNAKKDADNAKKEADNAKKDAQDAFLAKIEQKKIGIINALKRNKLTVQEIAEDFAETLEYILTIKSTI